MPSEVGGYFPSPDRSTERLDIDAAARSVLALDASDADWLNFQAAVEGKSFASVLAETREALRLALLHEAITPARLARSIASACLLTPVMLTLSEAMATAAPADTVAFLEQILRDTGVEVIDDPLMIALATTTVVADPKLEAILTAARAVLLATVINGGVWSEKAGELALVLAIQGFLNEYAWSAAAAELALVDRVAARLAAQVSANESPSLALLVILACYRPLVDLAVAPRLATMAWPEPIATLVRRQIIEPLQDIDRQSTIPELTAISDPVSRVVGRQYAEHPYPRWRRLGRSTHEIDRDFQPRNILIAGCGTGQHAIATALRHPQARLLGVDLSAPSLAFAARQAEALKLDRVRFARADILRLDEIDERFDLIESGGVLHHLADPEAGWGVLSRLLAPGGRLMVAVYSALGRRGLAIPRARLLDAGLATAKTSAEIVAARRHLLIAGGWSATEPALDSSDFYATSSCRDLLFHAQESVFTLPAIAGILSRLGLDFRSLEAPVAVLDAFRARNPAPEAERSLTLWDAFEQQAPDSFRGMYRVWAEKPTSQA